LGVLYILAAGALPGGGDHLVFAAICLEEKGGGKKTLPKKNVGDRGCGPHQKSKAQGIDEKKK